MLETAPPELASLFPTLAKKLQSQLACFQPLETGANFSSRLRRAREVGGARGRATGCDLRLSCFFALPRRALADDSARAPTSPQPWLAAAAQRTSSSTSRSARRTSACASAVRAFPCAPRTPEKILRLRRAQCWKLRGSEPASQFPRSSQKLGQSLALSFQRLVSKARSLTVWWESKIMSSAPGMCQAYPAYTSGAPEDVSTALHGSGEG